MILMHRCIQGNTLYMYEQFGVDEKLYVEVIRNSCSMAKHLNVAPTRYDIGESF